MTQRSLIAEQALTQGGCHPQVREPSRRPERNHVSNIQTVKAIYAAFLAGDIVTAMTHFANNVSWNYAGVSTDVPWLQAHQGRDNLGRAFQAIGLLDITVLEPRLFLEQGRTVVVLLRESFTVKATGRSVVEEEHVNVFHFDAAGKVERFRVRADTHAHWLAYHGDRKADL